MSFLSALLSSGYWFFFLLGKAMSLLLEIKKGRIDELNQSSHFFGGTIQFFGVESRYGRKVC